MRKVGPYHWQSQGLKWLHSSCYRWLLKTNRHGHCNVLSLAGTGWDRLVRIIWEKISTKFGQRKGKYNKQLPPSVKDIVYWFWPKVFFKILLGHFNFLMIIMLIILLKMTSIMKTKIRTTKTSKLCRHFCNHKLHCVFFVYHIFSVNSIALGNEV